MKKFKIVLDFYDGTTQEGTLEGHAPYSALEEFFDGNQINENLVQLITISKIV